MSSSKNPKRYAMVGTPPQTELYNNVLADLRARCAEAQRPKDDTVIYSAPNQFLQKAGSLQERPCRDRLMYTVPKVSSLDYDIPVRDTDIYSKPKKHTNKYKLDDEKPVKDSMMYGNSKKHYEKSSFSLDRPSKSLFNHTSTLEKKSTSPKMSQDIYTTIGKKNSSPKMSHQDIYSKPKRNIEKSKSQTSIDTNILTTIPVSGTKSLRRPGKSSNKNTPTHKQKAKKTGSLESILLDNSAMSDPHLRSPCRAGEGRARSAKSTEALWSGASLNSPVDIRIEPATSTSTGLYHYSPIGSARGSPSISPMHSRGSPSISPLHSPMEFPLESVFGEHNNYLGDPDFSSLPMDSAPPKKARRPLGTITMKKKKDRWKNMVS
ncbi:unnamed protein product, partial [Meganyctiphanes norvegica]